MCVHVCVCASVCVRACPCACVCVHVCVYMSSMDVIHQMIKVAATVVGCQSISRFAHRFVMTLDNNPQATKCTYKRFTVKSVGSQWPPGVKESVRNPVIPLTLAWYAVLANIFQEVVACSLPSDTLIIL